ncbi:extracellular matrix regulator RemB [Anaerovibrio sp.]|uniref:extracellular matrix regulator RemB n=1 Tax=Anaerovibrio sp. TaxID=1872532 RepID=UPI003F159C8E
MPVFIGGATAVAGERLLAIIDWRYFAAGDNRELLDRLQGQKRVFDITDGGRPKSLVITDNELYISPISPLTLKKRNDRLRKEICESDCVEEY